LLLVTLGRRPQDDRDHYGKKRLDLAGPLLEYLFRGLYRRMKKDLGRRLKKVYFFLLRYFQFEFFFFFMISLQFSSFS